VPLRASGTIFEMAIDCSKNAAYDKAGFHPGIVGKEKSGVLEKARRG